MDNELIDTSAKPVKVFLDTVNSVLNSNTFLLQFEAKTDNIDEALLNFLKSESFIRQLAKQDIERGWFNMHYFDHKTENYKLKHGNILKDKIELKIKEIATEKSEYLIAMLTGDTTKGRFCSFYSTQINQEKAKAIVDNFTSFLSLYGEWKLLFVEPDFLKGVLEAYPKNEKLRYFRGDFGNDTATIILTNNKGFLLLTNGID